MLILRWQKEEINWCGHDFVEYFTIVFRITYYFSLNDFFVYIVWNWPYFSNFLFVNLFFASQRINFAENSLSVWLTNNQLIFTWFESFLSPCRLFIKWKTRYKPVSWCISLVFKNFDQKYVLWRGCFRSWFDRQKCSLMKCVYMIYGCGCKTTSKHSINHSIKEPFFFKKEMIGFCHQTVRYLGLSVKLNMKLHAFL